MLDAFLIGVAVAAGFLAGYVALVSLVLVIAVVLAALTGDGKD